MSIRRTDAPAERTAEERERAREERERLRLERQGLPVPPPQVASESVSEAPPPRFAFESVSEAPPPRFAFESVSEAPPPPRFASEPVSEVPPPPQGEPDPPPPAPDPPMRRPHLHRPQLHRPQLHRPHLHRPHLHRPRMGRSRSLGARIGAIAALALVLAALAAGAFLVERHIRHKPLPGPAIVKVTIPEGLTRTQIAAVAHAGGLTGDYIQATRRATEIQPYQYGAASSEHSLEGFLFPATYDLYAGAPVSKLLSAQLSAFTEHFGFAQAKRAKALGLTPYGLLIVASMVEREASLTGERPLVAAVIYNRLHAHMPLGIDATIRYALHNYTRPLTEAQLHSSSPYNTRTHTGLPPTPISNPGGASIEAATHPAHVSYLYYVARADGCPGQVFSSSYTQFQRDAAAYQQALSRHHGRVPSCPKR